MSTVDQDLAGLVDQIRLTIKDPDKRFSHPLPEPNSAAAETISKLAKDIQPSPDIVPLSLDSVEALQQALTQEKLKGQALEKENQELKQQLLFDPLTGAYSLLAFTKHGQEKFNALKVPEQGERRRDVARHHETTIIAIDMDGFKKINDTFGHEEGDKALKHFVSFVQEHMSSGNLLARKGGDEFVILFDGSEEQAHKMMDRLRNEFQTQGYTTASGTPAYLSFSYGTHQISTVNSEHTKADKDIADAYKKADANCYLEKHVTFDTAKRNYVYSPQKTVNGRGHKIEDIVVAEPGTVVQDSKLQRQARYYATNREQKPPKEVTKAVIAYERGVMSAQPSMPPF